MPTTIDPTATYVVDGQEMSGDELIKSRLQEKDYTQKMQAIAPLRDLMERYEGIDDAETLAVTVSRAFDALAQAEEAGVQFTADGRVILPEPEVISEPAGGSTEDPTGESTSPSAQSTSPADDTLAAAEALAQRFQRLESGLATLLSTQIEQEIRNTYPHFQDEHMTAVMNLARANPNLTPMQHAEWLASQMPEPEAPAEKPAAPLPGGEPAGVPAAIKDKQITFRPTGEGEISVQDAINAFLDEEGVT